MINLLRNKVKYKLKYNIICFPLAWKTNLQKIKSFIYKALVTIGVQSLTQNICCKLAGNISITKMLF